ncbi:ead/Ea22-like family protein [Citrobacter sp. S5]|uniref:ead/Ea22-like family protein n=1 Tax=Citrobacter sp. S5 TaxID=3351561 RepID=UPI001A21206F|nr:ead/Ea22-like family protein [Citrobacter freundii]
MTALNKQALLRAAVKIGAHTWEAEGSQVWSISNGTADSLVLEVFGDKTSGQQDCDIASFIAAANSATVLALLDELEAAEKRIAELEARDRPKSVKCWSCKHDIEVLAIADCDGYCPRCAAPIDLDEEPYAGIGVKGE